MSITVTPVNDPPVAVDDTGITTPEDTAAVIPTATLTGNDTDIDGGPLTVTAVSDPIGGTVVLNGNNTITFTPTANTSGPASFTYTVSDGAGGTDTATVSITVTPVNDPPVAVDDTGITTPEDTAAVIPTATLTGNDTDIDGGPLTVTAVSDPIGGTVVLTGNNTITFTPTANISGPASFTYTVSDGALATDTATVSITVTPVNDAPTAQDFAGTVAEDSTNIPVDLTTLTDDIDGDALTYTITTPLANGTLTPTGTPGIYTYTPNANFTGPDSFTYTVSDGTLTDTGTVSVTVTNVNDAPDAVNDAATVNEDSGANPIAVLANDTDPDPADTRTITAVTQGANGTVAITGTGVSYTPNDNFAGTDTFTYTLTDAAGLTDTATVTVTVTNVNNDAPNAVNDAATVLRAASPTRSTCWPTTPTPTPPTPAPSPRSPSPPTAPWPSPAAAPG